MIAYLILVHRYPEQFKRLFNAIYSSDNHYLIHIDKKSDIEIHQNIELFLKPYANASLLTSEKAQWGGYSLVNIELRGMAKLLETNQNWTHFINLSGQDFPLKTQSFIQQYLTRNPKKEFILAHDQGKVRPDTMHRVNKICFEIFGRLYRTNIYRKFLKNVTPFIGTQWMIVSREFCEFACNSQATKRYKKYYKNSFIADEGFFQTVIMNSHMAGNVSQGDMREIDWVPDGDIKLRPRTFKSADIPHLINSRNLFARKFDLTQDRVVLDDIELHLKNETIKDVRKGSGPKSDRLAAPGV